eukprot:3835902-Rhodomonas_salina.2
MRIKTRLDLFNVATVGLAHCHSLPLIGRCPTWPPLDSEAQPLDSEVQMQISKATALTCHGPQA